VRLYISNGTEAFILTADYVRFDIKKQCTSGQSDLDIAYKFYDNDKTIHLSYRLAYCEALLGSPTHLLTNDKNHLEAFTPGQASSLPIYGSPARGKEFYK
jgi:hypothetical protein